MEKKERVRPVVICPIEEKRTRECSRGECDINNIMNKYIKTGVLAAKIRENPQYGDFSTVVDFQHALDIVRKAEEQFECLPAKIKNRFRNRPEEFLEYVNNPENEQEMIKLGMAIPKEIVKEEVKSSEPGSEVVK